MNTAGAMESRGPGQTASQPDARGASDPAAAVASDPLAEITAVVHQALAALSDAWVATLDAWRGALHQALLKLLALVLAAAVVAATTVVGVVFLLMGAAAGTAAALGCPLWAGYLAVGGLGAMLPGMAVHVWSKAHRFRRLRMLRAKYGDRLARRAAH